MTRIYYTKQDNKLISTKPILCGVRFAYIVIYLKEMKLEIKDAETGKVLASDYADTLFKLKKEARKATINLGATYYADIKNRYILK